MWSEEYQTELLQQNFAAFDEVRAKGYFVGEMVWNFADFMTKQGEMNQSIIWMQHNTLAMEYLLYIHLLASHL